MILVNQNVILKPTRITTNLQDECQTVSNCYIFIGNPENSAKPQRYCTLISRTPLYAFLLRKVLIF
jgi:hypothetical protein